MKAQYWFQMLLVGALVGGPIAQAQEHQHPAGPVEQLGQVNFPTSCNMEVQDDINQAVAMLHSFWYQAAEAAFVEISEQDPQCAMAYWGIAMSRFHQLWVQLSLESVQVGQAALQQQVAVGGIQYTVLVAVA